MYCPESARGRQFGHNERVKQVLSIQVEVVPQGTMPAAPTRTQASLHRGDIQGLRAVLMAQVLLYHAWQIGSPIGVDAFIMVSAYLMTSSFLRRTEAGRMPFFVERWGNTFKRLLPPLVLVVLATLSASLVILPAARWREITIQSFASITYWENWRLAAVSADYYADDHALSSPLQHLWSMSMQGQVFLLWPVIMTICVLLARKVKARPRALVAAAFGLLAVASLTWLVFLSPDDASVYFDTRSRIWEFALGSMIAALEPWLKVRRGFARWLVPIAFAVLMVYCLVPIGTYPGPMAAVPMLSVSAILLFSPTVPSDVVGRVLSWELLVSLGDISYAVYLVHWPIFVLYLAQSGGVQLGVVDGLALIAVSVALGWALTKGVDDPLRKMRWANRSTWNKYKMVLIWLAVGLIPVGAVYQWITSKTATLERQDEVILEPTGDGAGEASGDAIDMTVPLSGPGSNAHPGARVLLGDAESDFAGIPPIPDSLVATEQPQYSGECPAEAATILGEDNARFCSTYGDLASASKKAVVAGSSHAQQLLLWQILPLLDSQDGAAVSMLRGGCPWTMPGNFDEACSNQNQAVLDYVDLYHPDYAFLVVTLSTAASAEETLVPGVVELVEELTSRGITVFGISDSIRADQNLFECSDSRPDDGPIGGCLLPEDENFSDDFSLEGLPEIDGYHHIDMRDAYCVNGVCPTIIGNMNVYFDSNHVTTAYSRSVAPFFSQRVLDAILGNETQGEPSEPAD